MLKKLLLLTILCSPVSNPLFASNQSQENETPEKLAAAFKKRLALEENYIVDRAISQSVDTLFDQGYRLTRPFLKMIPYAGRLFDVDEQQLLLQRMNLKAAKSSLGKLKELSREALLHKSF